MVISPVCQCGATSKRVVAEEAGTSVGAASIQARAVPRLLQIEEERALSLQKSQAMPLLATADDCDSPSRIVRVHYVAILRFWVAHGSCRWSPLRLQRVTRSASAKLAS